MPDDGREPCRTGCGRNAALRNGEPAYKGFCSRCYKEDVEERKAARDGKATGGVRADGRVDGEGLGDGGDAAHDPRDGDRVELAERDEEDTLVRPPRQRGRKPPGGGTVHKPGDGPGKGELHVARSRFGWCLTNHHEGDEPEPIAPDRPELLDHWKGAMPTVCPGIVWFSTQGHWAGCPCVCHDHGDLAVRVVDPCPPAADDVA